MRQDSLPIASMCDSNIPSEGWRGTSQLDPAHSVLKASIGWSDPARRAGFLARYSGTRL